MNLKLHKLAVIFVIVLLISNIIYPLNAIGSSEKEDHVVVKLDSEKGNSFENRNNDKPNEEINNQITVNTDIPQTGPDEGDNSHPSGKDRSIEHGNSQSQGKSPSDPDEKENAHGGTSGQDKLGYDGGFDKGDQDGNNGCGNDDDFEDDNNGNCKGQSKVDHSQNPPQKNEGGCDKDGSTGDKNGRPCDPGRNNASDNGCLHGEPDCDKKGGTGGKNDEPKKQDEKSPNVNISIATNININNQVSTQVSNLQSTQQNTSQVLAASTLAATGDSLLRFGFTLLFTGLGSLILGIYFLGRKAIEKVFNSSYQTHLYVYEA